VFPFVITCAQSLLQGDQRSALAAFSVSDGDSSPGDNFDARPMGNCIHSDNLDALLWARALIRARPFLF
jgi:hypothetical protein